MEPARYGHQMLSNIMLGCAAWGGLCPAGCGVLIAVLLLAVVVVVGLLGKFPRRGPPNLLALDLDMTKQGQPPHDDASPFGIHPGSQAQPEAQQG